MERYRQADSTLNGILRCEQFCKTSILQTLLMLKQTVPPDWNGVIDYGDDSSLANLGSFDDIIHRHERDIPLEISLSWKFSEKLSLPDMDDVNALSFKLSVFGNENSVSGMTFDYTVGKKSLVVEWDGKDVRLTVPVQLAYPSLYFGAMGFVVIITIKKFSHHSKSFLKICSVVPAILGRSVNIHTGVMHGRASIQQV